VCRDRSLDFDVFRSRWIPWILFQSGGTWELDPSLGECKECGQSEEFVHRGVGSGEFDVCAFMKKRGRWCWVRCIHICPWTVVQFAPDDDGSRTDSAVAIVVMQMTGAGNLRAELARFSGQPCASCQRSGQDFGPVGDSIGTALELLLAVR
jgi:hypothetical protein